jgi:hypothetical protein
MLFHTAPEIKKNTKKFERGSAPFFSWQLARLFYPEQPLQLPK